MESSDTLMLVEEEASRCFCSEDCIMGFYGPRNDYFDLNAQRIRAELKLPEKDKLLQYKNSEEKIKQTLEEPDEVWEQENEVGEVYYTHLKEFKVGTSSFWMIIICFHFQEEPSYIFLTEVTNSKELVNYYRSEEEFSLIQYEADNEPPELEIPTEILESVELKKSNFLALLLQSRDESDIEYEKFFLYEKNTVTTLEDPDEIFKHRDEENDTLLTYVKSFPEDNGNFFYIVVCMKVDLDSSADDDVLIPIISFPSTDPNLYMKYATGERISGNIKN